jgi:hypothetical protein
VASGLQAATQHSLQADPSGLGVQQALLLHAHDQQHHPVAQSKVGRDSQQLATAAALQNTLA